MMRAPQLGQYTDRQTFTPGDLGQICRVDPKTVSTWELEGKIRALRTLGQHRRFLRKDLDFLPAGDPQLLKYGELAKALNVGNSTVSRWVAAGKLQSVILPGGYPRLLLAEVLPLLHAGRANGAH